MRSTSSKIPAKCSLSLATIINSKSQVQAPAAARTIGMRSLSPHRISKKDLVQVIVESRDAKKLINQIDEVRDGEEMTALSEGIFSASLQISTVQKLLSHEEVMRIQSKKKSRLHLNNAASDIQLRSSATTTAPRQVAETGKGVLIGVIDSGFDLSHPMFRDKNGKLRVVGLLDQNDGSAASREYTTTEIENAWSNGTHPGKDDDGHGTHVASIAGGTAFKGLEGIAPEAKFLLVKTDFLNTDTAIAWIYRKAGTTPCVVNMSLGHHYGAHDGTDAEERLHESLTGRGKIVVVSAGNEREDNIHLGGRFDTGQSSTVGFSIQRPDDGSAPAATITLWYDPSDEFEIEVVSPTGTRYPVPKVGSQKTYSASRLRVDLLRGNYAPSNLIQAQIQIQLEMIAPNHMLRNWSIKLQCKAATIGRLDGWFSNSGYGQFSSSLLVENSRTIGLSATGRACIAVASHVTKTQWKADSGLQDDTQSVIGRSSSFSSLGPTRDGRQKPDISAPGQWITAALAKGSSSEVDDFVSEDSKRLLTIAGTSMASPIITGVIALLLQKKKTLTPAQIRTILASSAVHDSHTGAIGWNPTYGHGKIDVVAALAKV